MNTALENLDATRQLASRAIPSDRKADLGQYMTPSQIANYMASLFQIEGVSNFRILDAGAGIGSLSAAFFERLLLNLFIEKVEWVGYEIDEAMNAHLHEYIHQYTTKFESKDTQLTAEVREVDFIEDAKNLIMHASKEKYNFAILNPPYKKIHSQSRHRTLLRELNIETVNLYSAFLALVIDLLTDKGQVVAIIPRSFCNGPYYKSFRSRLLQKTALRHIHLFAARNKAFGEEQVLQENIIIFLERNGDQSTVKISTSTDGHFTDYSENVYPFDQIILPEDPEKFIHIPLPGEIYELDLLQAFHYSLSDLGLEVSTGPVVDFRVKDYLRAMPESDTVPLIYPGHFTKQGIMWPKPDTKKPNALVINEETRKWLYAKGFYVVVRRFSSKEENRRIVASVVDPANFESYTMLGFENHLNVFHMQGNELPENVTHGLATYLNSTFVDRCFRRFSGHTQVNATDLRLLKYPSLEDIVSLGTWARQQPKLTQTSIDDELSKYVK